jgi:hypothetical protein
MMRSKLVKGRASGKRMTERLPPPTMLTVVGTGVPTLKSVERCRFRPATKR